MVRTGNWNSVCSDVSYNTLFNGWHYITWTFIGQLTPPYTHIVYVDGTQANTATGQFATGFAGHTYLGGNASGALNYLVGSIDELQISKSIRSPDWIATEYNNQSNPSTFWTVSAANSGAGSATPARHQVIIIGLLAKENMTGLT